MFRAIAPARPQDWPDFDQARDYEEAACLLAGAIRLRGFSDFNYGCINFLDSLVSTMDPEWIAHYLKEGLWRSDPLVVAARKRVAPFLISEIFNAPAVSSSENVMREAIAPHPRGIVVPIHCPDVGASVAAYLTTMDNAALEASLPGSMMELTLLSLKFHHAARRFYRHGRSTNMLKGLSGREREILTMSAAGKNSAEIGSILGISKTTVNNHIGKILKKMNVSTRSQAVALALQIGQISRTN